MTQEQLATGQLLACLSCGLPWLLGFFVAWHLRLRVHLLGWRHALLPKFVADWFDNLEVDE